MLKLGVPQARDAGHTWQENGDLLGVTRRAAAWRSFNGQALAAFTAEAPPGRT